MSNTTNDPQGEYMAKAEANAMDRIRSVAKEAASKVEQMMVAKAMEQAKRKEFETIERNEYDEIMNAQEDADEAKYGEQPKREPMLSDDHMNIMFASYGIGFAQYGDKVREYYENLITRGKLLTRETHNAVIQDAFDAAAEVDAAGGDAPHAPAFGLGPWIRMRFGFEKKP